MIEVEKEILANPFPGLRAFEEDEEYLFFGREKQIDDLLKKLSATRFLAVVGTSGSGKSSLVKCGLLPSLHSGFMTHAGSNWKITVFRPGNDPIDNMAVALAKPGTLYPEESMVIPFKPIIAATLKRSKLGLVEAIKQSELSPNENLLIVVDQFEELFRFSRYEKQTKGGVRDSLAFINLLLTASQQTELPIYVVFTMRSDFLGDCTGFRGLPEAINEGQYLIPRMMREEIKMAITGPIAVGGATIAPRLLTRLLNDVGDNPDQLPILQHALNRTWYYWKQRGKYEEAIDIEEYTSIGTMSKALSQHAEEAFAELKTDRAQKVCELLFKTITEKGTSVSGIRRPTKLDEICQLAEADKEEVVAIIEVFRKPERSFLMPPVGVELSEDSIIDISHESLMRVWTRLIGWVEEEAQSAENYVRLAEAAALYQEGVSGLWRDPELEFSLKWRERNAPNKIWAQRYERSFERAMNFLDYSKRQQDFEISEKGKQQKRRIKRAKAVTILVSVAAICSLFFGIWASVESKNARDQQDIAEGATKVAKDEKANAITAQGIAEDEKANAVTAQGIAEDEKANAVTAQGIAEDERANAIKSQGIAEFEKANAVTAQGIAEVEKANAKKAESRALDRKKDADTLRYRAKARNLSFIAIQLLNEGKITEGTDSAMEAYSGNWTYRGPNQNDDIYQALHKAIRKHKSKDYTYTEHKDAIRIVAVDSQNGLIASGDESGQVHITAIMNKSIEQKFTLPGSEPIRSLRYSPDGKYLVAGTLKGSIKVWDVATRSTKDTLFSGAIKSMVFMPYKKTDFLVFCTKDILYIGEISDGRLVSVTSKAIKGISAMAVSKDGNSLILAAGKTLSVYKPTSNASLLSTLEPIDLETDITSLAVSGDNQWIAAGMKNGKIYIDKLPTLGDDGQYFPFHLKTSKVSGLAFYTVNGRVQLASASYDKTARLLDVRDLMEHINPAEDKFHLKGHDGWIHSLAYSSNGNYLITVSKDRKIRLWPTSAKQMNKTLSDL